MNQPNSPWYVSAVLCLIAVIFFALTAFGVTFGTMSTAEMIAGGLAFFAAAHLVP